MKSLFTLIALLVAFSMAFVSADDRPKEETKKKSTQDSESNAESKKIPRHRWKVGETYRYLWFTGRQRSGTTTFTIKKHPKKEKWFKVEATNTFSHNITNLKTKRTYEIDENWILRRSEGTTDMLGIQDTTSHTEDTSFVDGNFLVVEAISNHDKDNTIRYKIPFNTKSLVMYPQCMEFWALFSPMLLPIEEKRAKKIIYPYFDRTYDVTFTKVGTVEHLRAGKTIELTHYKFKSANTQLYGEIWIDKKGKLYQYKQINPTKKTPPLVVSLDLPAKKKDSDPSNKDKKGKENKEKK